MNKMMKAQIMDCAWDISHTAVTFFGGKAKEYIGQSLHLIYDGLEQALVPFTTTQEVKLQMASNGSFVGKLIQLGGSEWQKYGKHRIYFNRDVQMELLGLETRRYCDTGKIFDATLGGEEITIFRAKSIIASLDKFWYDVNDDTFYCSDSMPYELFERICDNLKAL